MDLAEFLLNYKEENFDTIVNVIKGSPLVNDESTCKQFIRTLIKYSNIRPKSPKIYAKILKYIYENDKSPEILQNSILHVCLTSTQYLQQMNLLYQCFINGIIPFEMIHKNIKYLIDNNDYVKELYASFLCFFAPVFIKEDPKTFNSLKFFVLRKMDKNLFLEKYEPFLECMTKDKIDDLQLLIDNIYDPNSVEYHIMNDDFDAANVCFCQPDFSDHMIMRTTFFSCSDLMTAKLTPIKLAAYFGSLNIFKYFVMKLDLVWKNESEIVPLAIAGGNMEILRILMQKGCNFGNALEMAAKYHRYSVFEWLVEQCNFEVTFTDLNQCCMVNNLTSLKYSLESEFAGNIKESEAFNVDALIETSIKSGSQDVFKYLLDVPHQNINFALAVIWKQPYIAKILLERSDVIFDYQQKYSDIFTLVARCGDADVIKIFLESGKYEITERALSCMYGEAYYYTDIFAQDYLKEFSKQSGINIIH